MYAVWWWWQNSSYLYCKKTYACAVLQHLYYTSTVLGGV